MTFRLVILETNITMPCIQISILFDCEMKPKRLCFVIYGIKDLTERVPWVSCCFESINATYWAIKNLKVLKPACFLVGVIYFRDFVVVLVWYYTCHSIKIWITSFIVQFDGFFIKSWNMYAMAPSRPFPFSSSHVTAICYKSIKLSLWKFLDTTHLQ